MIVLFKCMSGSNSLFERNMYLVCADEMYQSALSLNPSLLRSSSMDMLPQDITDGHMQHKSDNKG